MKKQFSRGTSIMQVFIGVISLYYGNATAATCTLPSYMTGLWYDSKFIEVDFIGNNIMYLNQYDISRKASTTNLTCISTTDKRYIFRTVNTISAIINGALGNYYYYLCMEVTKITDYSFYYYLQTDADNNGERTHAATSGTLGSNTVCSTTSTPVAILHAMVRSGFASSAVQQCAYPFLGDFAFTFDDTANTKSKGNLTVCNTLTTANTTYSTTGTVQVAFAGKKYFGCVASVQSGSIYYSMWYNFDTAVDFALNPRFACVVATYDGTNVTASQRGRVCAVDQVSTSKPDTSIQYPATTTNTAGGLLHLIPYRTCIPTSSSDSSSAAIIAAVVVILLLLICAAVGSFLFYKFYYLPKKQQRERLIEEQKKPKSHIGMMKSAVHAGYGGNIHKDPIDVMELEDEDEGIEGSITGHHPDRFKEHNNNIKLHVKFIGTSTPVTPSGVETEFDDPNSVPENKIIREKSKLVTGISANTQSTAPITNDTARAIPELNGHVANGNIPNELPIQSGNIAQPVITTAVVHTDTSKLQREKSMVPEKTVESNVKSKAPDVSPVNMQKEKSMVPEKPVESKVETKSPEVPAANKKTTVATVNPYTEEKPKILQNPKPSDDKKDEKLRKSVSFAGDKPVAPATLTNQNKTNLPGTIQDEPDTIITFPREPSNLMGPRDTTLPEIDLKNF